MSVSCSNFVTGEVIENHAWTERLFTLTIRTQQQQFKAGQFVRLQLSVDGDSIAKPYSLVNSPQESHMELFYNTVPDGRLSKALADLKTGDRVEVSQPANGFFVLDEIPTSKHLWMIATGTGLGPYISILKTDDVWQRFEKVILVHGVPLTEELVFSKLKQSWQQKHPDKFQFISNVTREKNPDGLHGRITDSLQTGELEQMTGIKIDKENSHIMLCGNHNMINDMKLLLAKRDMARNLRHKPGQITTEQYY